MLLVRNKPSTGKGAGRTRTQLVGKRQPIKNIKPLGARSHSTARENPDGCVFLPCEVRAAVRVRAVQTAFFLLLTLLVSASLTVLSIT